MDNGSGQTGNPRKFHKAVPMGSSVRKNSKAWIIILIFILFIALFMLIVFKLLGKNSLQSLKKKGFVFSPKTMTIFPVYKASPSPLSGSPSASIFPASVSATKKASASALTALNRVDLNVYVENGSGQPGSARQVAQFLKNLGYKIGLISNANNFAYNKLTIQIKANKKAYLPLLESDLSKNYSIASASANLSSGLPEDALVIVGK